MHILEKSARVTQCTVGKFPFTYVLVSMYIGTLILQGNVFQITLLNKIVSYLWLLTFKKKERNKERKTKLLFSW